MNYIDRGKKGVSLENPALHPHEYRRICLAKTTQFYNDQLFCTINTV